MVACSCPGGPAPQFRVQYLRPHGSIWQRYASFRQRERAERCAQDLLARGLVARVILYGMIPTGR
jgi:hypothetical protein